MDGQNTNNTAWNEAIIIWADKKEPVQKQRAMFSWAKHQWSIERMAEEYIKLHPNTHDESDKSHLISFFQKKRWERQPPSFRYRVVEQ